MIVKDDLHPLLGATTIQTMGLVSMNKGKFQMVARVSKEKELNTHMSISPCESKANGKVESEVKIVKNLFRKYKVAQADAYLANLDH